MTVPCNQLKKLLRRILSHSFSRTLMCVLHLQLISTRPATVQGRVASVCRDGAALVRRADEKSAVTRGGGQGPPAGRGRLLGSRAEALISIWSLETGIFKLPFCLPSCSSWLLRGWPTGKSLAAQTELRGGQMEQAQQREVAAWSLASGLR